MAALHVVHVIYALATGGMEKGVTTVIRGSSPDLRHTVVCLSTTGPMAKRLPPETQVVEMHKPPGNSPRFLWKLARELRRLGPDVVHTRNWGGLDGVVAARLAGIRGIVHGEHGWEIGDAKGDKPHRRWYRRLLSLTMAELTCVSRDIERWLREIGIRRPITQIVNGVDTDRLHPGEGPASLRDELGIAPDAFLAGIVGRLDPIKDHPTLFQAIASVREQGVDAHLLVVGDGSEEERLRDLAGPGVHFLGRRGDVPELLRALDVFTLSSINEGISNTILEAMATGLPVIVTRTGGNPELVEDGAWGVLVEVGDHQALANAMLAYARDPELAARHGRTGRKQAVERFSVERMVAAYEQVYRRVAAAKNKKTRRSRR